MSNVVKTQAELNVRDNFIHDLYLPKHNRCHKNVKKIGTFIIRTDSNKQHILANYTQFPFTMPYHLLLKHKSTYNYVRNTYTIETNDTNEFVQLKFTPNNGYHITDNTNSVIYDENDSSGKEIKKLSLYVCTFNFYPFESKIKLIDLLFSY
jgi:hypothetical protein